jgi:uncharacterized membrane protein
MSVNPNQGQNTNPNDPYGGYGGGYTPPVPPTPPTPPSQPYDPNSAYSAPPTGQQGSPGYQGYYQQQSSGQQQSGSSQSQQQQYSGPYQPPRSAYTQGNSEANDPTSLGMNARNEAVLSYALWWLSGLVFFVIERKNRFVRFAAAQSFFTLGGAFLLYVLIRVITLIPVIGFLLNPILSCLAFVVLVPSALLWLFLMVQSYRGVKVKLPIVGDLAESFVDRTMKKKSV